MRHAIEFVYALAAAAAFTLGAGKLLVYILERIS
jgi:hypothetical protein